MDFCIATYCTVYELLLVSPQSARFTTVPYDIIYCVIVNKNANLLSVGFIYDGRENIFCGKDEKGHTVLEKRKKNYYA